MTQAKGESDMILEELAAGTRARIACQKKELPLETLRAQAEAMAAEEKILGARGDFAAFPFEQALRQKGLSFICEVKKASPSKGVIAEEFPYVQIAREYEAAGACAISVLTEPDRFLGRDQYLKEIAEAVSIPVLRKDFTVDEYMIYQAKVLGASAVLLICSILSQEQLKEYQQLADRLGLSALVEAHTEEEIGRALEAGARIVGVNNRNLKDFTVDVMNSVRLRPLVPESVVFVSESGIRTPEDTGRLYENGTDAVLIGETFMRSPNKKKMLDALRMG